MRHSIHGEKWSLNGGCNLYLLNVVAGLSDGTGLGPSPNVTPLAQAFNNRKSCPELIWLEVF